MCVFSLNRSISRFLMSGIISFCPIVAPLEVFAVMSNFALMIAGGPPVTRKSCISYASPISTFSDALLAVTRPPGRGMTNGTMLNGFDGSGLLGLIAATSKVADEALAAGAVGSCADAVIAAIRMARVRQTRRNNMMEPLCVANSVERPGRQGAGHQRQQHWGQHPGRVCRWHVGDLHTGRAQHRHPRCAEHH